jgi:hypothetical protein
MAMVFDTAYIDAINQISLLERAVSYISKSTDQTSRLYANAVLSRLDTVTLVKAGLDQAKVSARKGIVSAF